MVATFAPVQSVASRGDSVWRESFRDFAEEVDGIAQRASSYADGPDGDLDSWRQSFRDLAAEVAEVADFAGRYADIPGDPPQDASEAAMWRDRYLSLLAEVEREAEAVYPDPEP